MKRNKRKNNPGDPKPLNFDNDEKTGPSDHLRKPYTTPSDRRGDNKETQYYQEEEAMSPEEVRQRKKEGDL